MELFQLAERRQRVYEVLVVALCLEVQHARLERSFLAGVPYGCELRVLSRAVPRLVPDDKRVELGDSDVGKHVDGVAGVGGVRAGGKVGTAAQ